MHMSLDHAPTPLRPYAATVRLHSDRAAECTSRTPACLPACLPASPPLGCFFALQPHGSSSQPRLSLSLVTVPISCPVARQSAARPKPLDRNPRPRPPTTNFGTYGMKDGRYGASFTPPGGNAQSSHVCRRCCARRPPLLSALAMSRHVPLCRESMSCARVLAIGSSGIECLPTCMHALTLPCSFVLSRAPPPLRHHTTHQEIRCTWGPSPRRRRQP